MRLLLFIAIQIFVCIEQQHYTTCILRRRFSYRKSIKQWTPNWNITGCILTFNCFVHLFILSYKLDINTNHTKLSIIIYNVNRCSFMWLLTKYHYQHNQVNILCNCRTQKLAENEYKYIEKKKNIVLNARYDRSQPTNLSITFRAQINLFAKILSIILKAFTSMCGYQLQLKY